MELVGRRFERETLERAFDRAASGRRTVALVRGVAGIGKTALVAEFRSLAVARGAFVIGTSVTEVESSIGWSGTATLMRGVDRDLLAGMDSSQLDVLDALGGPTSGGTVDPLSVASALSAALAALADSRPLVVVLDDLHWFDRATAGALSFTIRLLGDHPILLVATARPVDLPVDLARIVDAEDLVVIEPSALSLGATRELLASRFSVQLGHVDLVRLHELSSGNPLHVVETGRLVQAGVPVAEATLPGSLRALIEVGLGDLDALDAEVLAACALMPKARPPLLYGLFPHDVVDAALNTGERLQLLHVDVGDDDTVVFRHPLVRSGLAERLPLMARRRLHRRCADLDVPIEVRAFHLGQSIVGPDAEAAGALDAAAASTRRSGMLVDALMHAERALALTDRLNGEEMVRRTLQAADLAIAAGDPQRGLDLVDPLIVALNDDEQQPMVAAELLSLAGRAHSGLSGSAAALPWLERAAATLPAGSPERARLLGSCVWAMLFVDVDQARRRGVEFVTAADASDDRLLGQVARAALNVAEALGGLPLSSSSGPAPTALDIDVLNDWLEVAVWTDDHARADDVLAEAMRRITERPSVTNEHNVVMQASDLRGRQGRLDEAAVLAERAWALSDAIDGGSGRSSELAVIAATRGDVDTAHRHLAMLESRAPDTSALAAAQVDYATGVVAARDGDHRLAIEKLASAVALLDGCGVRDLGALPVRPELLDSLIHAGELDEAARIACEIVDLAERSGRPRGAAEALRAQAHIAAGRRRLEEATELASSAIDAFDAIGLPIERARALVLAGSVARRSRRRTQAREFLDQAQAEFVRCGALGFLPLVRDELERLGDRGDATALTKTERKIADLVAGGSTNADVAAQLYLSVRTVEAHLTRIYRKEGVRGRAELAARYRP